MVSVHETMAASPLEVHHRLPALDGLRGVAILLVLLAHLFVGVSPVGALMPFGHTWLSGGGFAGVQLFFVLSGFLITTILLREYEASGRIRLRRFYWRRIRRLVPPLVVVCAAYVAFVHLTRAGAGVLAGHGSVLRALTYSYNLPWTFVSADNGWLGHTWSLAVEEQFYLLWPLLLVVGYRVRGRHGVATVALAGAVATAALRHSPDTWPHAYTMLRWDAPLAGCTIAALQLRVPRWAALAGVVAVIAVALRYVGGTPWGLHVCNARLRGRCIGRSGVARAWKQGARPLWAYLVQPVPVARPRPAGRTAVVARRRPVGRASGGDLRPRRTSLHEHPAER